MKSHLAQAFDAILIMGPLYHLTQLADRVEIMSQAVRVLRKAGDVRRKVHGEWIEVPDDPEDERLASGEVE